jgi:hypothetical protein
LLTVTFTVPKNNLRVILARPMNKRERKNYALEQTEKDIMDKPAPDPDLQPAFLKPIPANAQTPPSPIANSSGKAPSRAERPSTEILSCPQLHQQLILWEEGLPIPITLSILKSYTFFRGWILA